MKHTPGPWEWDSNPCDFDPNQEAPWLVAANDPYPPILGGAIQCISEANARLIASAPDMLEVLKAVANATDVVAYGAALQEVHAIIAKATGEKP